MVTKKYDEFVIFHQFFFAEVCNWAQVLVKRSPTLGTLISTKTKCIKLIFIGKITLVPVAFLMALSIYRFFLAMTTGTMPLTIQNGLQFHKK